MLSAEGNPDEYYMRMALQQARLAMEEGEVPTGAVIVHFTEGPEGRKGEVIARAHNQVEILKDPTAHAEMIAITQATNAQGDWRLTDTALYVTKEPCPICAGAILLARIPRVVFGVPDPLRGGAGGVFNILDHPNFNHRAEIVSGVMETECRELLQQFFQACRSRN